MHKRKFTFYSAGWLLCIWIAWFGMVSVLAAPIMLLTGDFLTEQAWAYYLFTGVMELALIAPVIGFMLFAKQPLRALLGRKFHLGQVAIGALIGIFTVPAVMALSMFWQAFIVALGGGKMDLSMPAMRNIGELLLGMGVLGIFAAVVEEPMFRGILQRGLGARLGKWPALFITAVLFALCHFQHMGLPTLAVVGLLLGVLTWRTGSLWPSLAMHCSYNMSVTLLDYVLNRLNGLMEQSAQAAELAQQSVLTQLVLGGASWAVIGLPFAALVAGLLLVLHRITPRMQQWSPEPWEKKHGDTRWWHWIPWVLAVVLAIAGLIPVLLQDFGFFDWLTRVIEDLMKVGGQHLWI